MGKIKIGINGFGRIGRMVLRAAIERDDVEVVAINDLLDIKHLAYLLKYDSVHGKCKGDVRSDDNSLIVDGKKIQISSERDPKKIAWDLKGVDVVLECTGIFTSLETAQLHIDGGAPKVVISAPSKDAPMYVMGVNHDEVDKNDLIISYKRTGKKNICISRVLIYKNLCIDKVKKKFTIAIFKVRL